MITGLVVLVAIIAYLLWKIKYSAVIIGASNNDWLVLEWYKRYNPESIENDTTIHIQFVPIIGWEYNRWSHKYGALSPVTPPHYQVNSRIDVGPNSVLQVTSYWIHDGASCHISDYWTHGGDFWEELLDWADNKIEVHGDVPDSYRTRLFEIVSISEENQKKDRNKLDAEEI